MARPIRFIPAGSVVEVTIRTIHERLLMVPDRHATNLIAGVIGRAQAMYGVRIHAIIAMSNHLQMLLSVRDARQLADFMAYVNGNIAREVGALRRWRQRFWGRRYRAIVVADPQSQIARLRYIFSNSCKEGLVANPQFWPGVSSARAIMKDEPMIGTWFDRTAEHRSRRTGQESRSDDHATRYEIRLSPVPSMAHLSADEYKTFCRGLISGLVDGAWDERGPDGFLGAAKVLSAEPHARPRSSSHTPAPYVHAATREARHAFRALLDAFVVGCRQAKAYLMDGRRVKAFPTGALLPGGMPAHVRDPVAPWPPPFAIDGGIIAVPLFAA